MCLAFHLLQNESRMNEPNRTKANKEEKCLSHFSDCNCAFYISIPKGSDNFRSRKKEQHSEFLSFILDAWRNVFLMNSVYCYVPNVFNTRFSPLCCSLLSRLELRKRDKIYGKAIYQLHQLIKEADTRLNGMEWKRV